MVKQFKRIIVAGLISALTVALSACGGGDASPTIPATTTPAPASGFSKSELVGKTIYVAVDPAKNAFHVVSSLKFSADGSLIENLNVSSSYMTPETSTYVIDETGVIKITRSSGIVIRLWKTSVTADSFDSVMVYSTNGQKEERWFFNQAAARLQASAYASGMTIPPSPLPLKFLVIPPDGAFVAPANNVAVDFADVVGGTVNVTDTDITATITVRNLPATLTFHQTGVQLDHLEYEWAVDFDVNDDGFSDFSMATTSWNWQTAPKTVPLAAGVQVDLWKESSDSFVMSSVGHPSLKVEGNSITMTIPKSAASASITALSKIRIRTTYTKDATTVYTDLVE